MKQTSGFVVVLRVLGGMSFAVVLILLMVVYHDIHYGALMAGSAAYNNLAFMIIGGFAILGLILLLIAEWAQRSDERNDLERNSTPDEDDGIAGQ